jgi:hypothetical protein
MKTILLIAVIFVAGCKHNASKKTSGNEGGITKHQNYIRSGKALIRAQIDYRKSEIEDSLLLKAMMRDVLLYAYKHKNASSYHKTIDDGNFKSAITSATIIFGNLFDKVRRHLIVRRSIAGSIVNVDIFLFTKNRFRLVCSGVLDDNTYLNDAIKDVNGDHQKDFLVHWYPSSGCCRRNIYNVYLYQQYSGTFSKSYEFINPTFSPSEKLIRGIGYGQPGNVDLYKYKWNGLNIDTIELILSDTLSKKFHVFKHWRDFDNPKSGKYLAFVPKEYHKIESYDWFKGIY